jgi:glycerol-3-phosphate acyltransferase PlsX
MKIIVDAMGGDNAPSEIIRGALMAREERKIDIILTGRGEEILKALNDMGVKDLPQGIEIAHASEIVSVEDDPATVCRAKKDSSMSVALRMLAEGEADAMVSAGSTGALLSGATLLVKRVRGIRRAALAPVLPIGDKGLIVIDSGANVDCTPEYLLQFAYMGSFYAKSVMNLPQPRVGLLNNGIEQTKGTELHTAAYALLKRADDDGRLNFIGNVEANDATRGRCDVLVCDGFSGNILLKGLEGSVKLILGEVKGVLTKSFRTKIAAALLKKDFMKIKETLDQDRIGGTPLLGISKPVIKAHGSSSAVAICSAIMQAANTVTAGVVEDIKDNIEFMKIDTSRETAT